MILIDSNKIEIEINDRHLPLAEDILARWGIETAIDDISSVSDLNDITPELSAWGIPWRYL